MNTRLPGEESEALPPCASGTGFEGMRIALRQGAEIGTPPDGFIGIPR